MYVDNLDAYTVYIDVYSVNNMENIMLQYLRVINNTINPKKMQHVCFQDFSLKHGQLRFSILYNKNCNIGVFDFYISCWGDVIFNIFKLIAT